MSSTQIYCTAPQVIRAARAIIGKEYQKEWARRFHISESYLSDFLNGNRPPGPRLLKALGFERKPYYRKARKKG